MAKAKEVAVVASYKGKAANASLDAKIHTAAIKAIPRIAGLPAYDFGFGERDLVYDRGAVRPAFTPEEADTLQQILEAFDGVQVVQRPYPGDI